MGRRVGNNIPATRRTHNPPGVPIREAPSLSRRALVILACEGEKTERLYFEAWFAKLREARRLSPKSCVIAPHEHTNPTGVLADLQAYQHLGIDYEDFDHKWIVIDRDEVESGTGGHTKEDFNTVLSEAKKCGVEVAYSNPSFELWYLLHYNYRDTPIGRDELGKTLGALQGKAYDKADATQWNRLSAMTETAVRNAENLLRSKEGIVPSEANPSTTVHKLVRLLIEELKKR